MASEANETSSDAVGRREEATRDPYAHHSCCFTHTDAVALGSVVRACLGRGGGPAGRLQPMAAADLSRPAQNVLLPIRPSPTQNTLGKVKGTKYQHNCGLREWKTGEGQTP